MFLLVKIWWSIFGFWSHPKKGLSLYVNVNVICLPTEHHGVHKNSFRNVRAFQDRIGIWKCWFLRRWENRSTRRKTSQSRIENKQQTQPTYDAESRNRTLDRSRALSRLRHPCAIPAPCWNGSALKKCRYIQTKMPPVIKL